MKSTNISSVRGRVQCHLVLNIVKDSECSNWRPLEGASAGASSSTNIIFTICTTKWH